MPIYEYRCEKCGKVFEKMQKFSDAPVEVHEDCGGAVERLISTSALMFKGSGFYITDYAKSGAAPKGEGHSSKSEGKSEGSESKGGSESQSESKSSSETKSETKSDSKPSSETKSESKPASTSTKSDS